VVQFETLLSLRATLGTWETRTRESAKKRNGPKPKPKVAPGRKREDVNQATAARITRKATN
jgi:hypothetical protein